MVREEGYPGRDCEDRGTVVGCKCSGGSNRALAHAIRVRVGSLNEHPRCSPSPPQERGIGRCKIKLCGTGVLWYCF